MTEYKCEPLREGAYRGRLIGEAWLGEGGGVRIPETPEYWILVVDSEGAVIVSKE